MKKIYSIIAIAIACVTFSPSSQAIGLDEAVSKIIATFDKNPDPQVLCREGNAYKGIFSLRSFEGLACGKIDAFDIFALNICGDIDGFKTKPSKCYKNIPDRLKSQTPEQTLNTLADASATTDSTKKKAFKAVCNPTLLKKLQDRVASKNKDATKEKLKLVEEKCAKMNKPVEYVVD